LKVGYQEEEGCRTLADLYELAEPGYGGRSTVPVLWTNERRPSQQSAEIIVMLNSEFNEFASSPRWIFTQSNREKIDRWNEKIYHSVNNGVYRCLPRPKRHDEACNQLFATLDEIDAALRRVDTFVDSVTLADVRLFTLFRFDIAYYGLFSATAAEFRIIRIWGPTCVTLSASWRRWHLRHGECETGLWQPVP